MPKLSPVRDYSQAVVKTRSASGFVVYGTQEDERDHRNMQKPEGLRLGL